MMCRRTARGRQGGFTLLETAFAVTLISLVFLGVMNLYATVCSGTARTLAQVDAAAKGANAVQWVTGRFREAGSAALPGESAFTPGGGFTVGDCTTTYAGQTINTAALLSYPGAGSLSVSYGGRTQAVTPAPYDRTASATTTLLIYRGNYDGTPNAAGGQYLCQTSGGTAAAARICTLSDAAAVAAATGNAVQFTRTGANQVEFRVIVSDYSLTSGQMGSESAQTPLTAKCVLMRNHG